MKSDDILELFFQTITAFRVQYTLLTDITEEVTPLDFAFRKEIYKDYDYQKMLRPLLNLTAPDTPFQYQDEFGLYYLYVALPESTKSTVRQRFCIIGPYIYQPYQMDELKLMLLGMKLSNNQATHAQTFFQQVPVILDMMAWRSLTGIYLTRILGKLASFREIRHQDVAAPVPGKFEYELNPEIKPSYAAVEKRYEIENRMLRAVSRGQTWEALNYYNQFLEFRLAKRSDNELRSDKNLGLAANTLLRKTVQGADVHPLHIDEVSTQFAIQIELLGNELQLRTLIREMIRKYCKLVKNYSRNQYCPTIHTCLDYIDFHYHEPLSLSTLAHLTAVSSGYLSALFHREVGMTATEYINQIRIRQALILLNTTDLTVLSVAGQVGFEDANYFTRVFKRFHNISPREYRHSLAGHE